MTGGTVTSTETALQITDTQGRVTATISGGTINGNAVNETISYDGSSFIGTSWSYDDETHWYELYPNVTLKNSNTNASHVWSVDVTEPTSTSDGVITSTCDVCGHTKTVVIPAGEYTHTSIETFTGRYTFLHRNDISGDVALSTTIRQANTNVNNPTNTPFEIYAATATVIDSDTIQFTISMSGNTAYSYRFYTGSGWKTGAFTGETETIQFNMSLENALSSSINGQSSFIYNTEVGIDWTSENTYRIGWNAYYTEFDNLYYYVVSYQDGGNHQFSDEWTYDDDNHWHECVNGDGYRNYTAAHTWSVDVTEPTSTSDGVITSTCDVCGHTKTVVIPAGEYTLLNINGAQANYVYYVEDGVSYKASFSPDIYGCRVEPFEIHAATATILDNETMQFTISITGEAGCSYHFYGNGGISGTFIGEQQVIQYTDSLEHALDNQVWGRLIGWVYKTDIDNDSYRIAWERYFFENFDNLSCSMQPPTGDYFTVEGPSNEVYYFQYDGGLSNEVALTQSATASWGTVSPEDAPFEIHAATATIIDSDAELLTAVPDRKDQQIIINA